MASSAAPRFHSVAFGLLRKIVEEDEGFVMGRFRE